MIQQIKTTEDVRTFFNDLLAEDLNFHPDDDFSNYINCETKEPLYTAHEADLRNQLLDQAFDICDRNAIDIYELSVEIFTKDFHNLFLPEL